ncbi:caffeoyl-CoA O-methyltransferase 2 [Tolypocladium capitatum]|uniref:Caffeoyl-CoA O-methyltransferase 2 n=1 Tax=Tolypocladium capitatum TaxID=45235 RepID=A0A2K3Q4Z3_9HYPO|nr:caffeoyl-CoA O-methyltransferase 2 [Tolypocladium capitatum]
MKDDGTAGLYGNPATGQRVTAYATAHSTALPRHVTDYHAAAAASRPDSMMLSSNFQSQLHLLLANAIGAKRGGWAIRRAPATPASAAR